jgi:hypothetical protein
MIRALVTALALSTVWVSCTRPGEEQCEKACLHYSKLYQDDHWAPKLAAASTPEERAKVEADKAAEWDDIKTNPERGLGSCMAACDRILRQGMVDCILKTTTFAEAKACNE